MAKKRGAEQSQIPPNFNQILELYIFIDFKEKSRNSIFNCSNLRYIFHLNIDVLYNTKNLLKLYFIDTCLIEHYHYCIITNINLYYG